MHITQTARGNVHFHKTGVVRLTIDGTTGRLKCFWLFEIIGGTGIYKGASGLLFATGEGIDPVDLTTFDPEDGVPFYYDFAGIIVFDD